MNGLTDLFVKLKNIFNGKFIMTSEVKYETIDRPLQIKKFELAALKIKKLLDDGIFEPPSKECSQLEIKNETAKILNYANNSLTARGEFIHLIDRGEASCIAMDIMCRKAGIKSVIVIDERTTRMLGEKPENLRKLLESKLHTSVEMKHDFEFMKDITFIRSSELVYIAWRKNLIELKGGDVLDALLYATKFKGNSISRQEIEEIKRIGRAS